MHGGDWYATVSPGKTDDDLIVASSSNVSIRSCDIYNNAHVGIRVNFREIRAFWVSPYHDGNNQGPMVLVLVIENYQTEQSRWVRPPEHLMV